jgi:hypothetical protein
MEKIKRITKRDFGVCSQLKSKIDMISPKKEKILSYIIRN